MAKKLTTTQLPRSMRWEELVVVLVVVVAAQIVVAQRRESSDNRTMTTNGVTARKQQSSAAAKSTRSGSKQAAAETEAAGRQPGRPGSKHNPGQHRNGQEERKKYPSGRKRQKTRCERTGNTTIVAYLLPTYYLPPSLPTYLPTYLPTIRPHFFTLQSPTDQLLLPPLHNGSLHTYSRVSYV